MWFCNMRLRPNVLWSDHFLKLAEAEAFAEIYRKGAPADMFDSVSKRATRDLKPSGDVQLN